MVTEWWNAEIAEWNGMEWWPGWLVGGMVVWRLVLPQEQVTRKHLELDGTAVLLLHEFMCVRIVFGCICDDSKLELRGGTPGSPSSW